MLQKGKKTLIFPVETVVRELDFRLILAVLCARPGWQIIVGDHEDLFKLTTRLKNAVLVLKNLTGGKRPWKYKRYKQQNIRCIQLDEEGGVYQGDEEAWKLRLRTRLNPLELEGNDEVCTWGDFQAEFYISEAPHRSCRIIATGHPRLDLCKPCFHEIFKEESIALREKYGRIILINTNLVSNNRSGTDAVLRLNNICPEDIERRSFHIEQLCHEIQRAAHFIRLINHLSNSFTDLQIVLRPHPSEDMRIYQKVLKYVPRVTVTREGSLQAWFQSCEVLIHDGCTTAIEGYLSGTPVINFHPVEDARFEIPLPNLVGLCCRTESEVEEAIRGICHGRRFEGITPDNLDRIRRVILNFDPQCDSFKNLSAIISKHQDETLDTEIIGPWPLLIRRRLLSPFVTFSAKFGFVRRLLCRRDRGYEKYPPIDQKALMKKLKTIEKIAGVSVNIKFHTARIFSMTRSNI